MAFDDLLPPQQKWIKYFLSIIIKGQFVSEYWVFQSSPTEWTIALTNEKGETQIGGLSLSDIKALSTNKYLKLKKRQSKFTGSIGYYGELTPKAFNEYELLKLENLRSIATSFETKKEKPLKSLIPQTIFQSTRKYIEEIVIQINGCFQEGWYDACAVMIRRLIETLIIECFEQHHISEKVKQHDGNYFPLKELISLFLAESIWTVGRNTKLILPKIKGIGDLSAHNRRYIATQNDIIKYQDDIRIAIQELIFIAGFDKKN